MHKLITLSIYRENNENNKWIWKENTVKFLGDTEVSKVLAYHGTK